MPVIALSDGGQPEREIERAIDLGVLDLVDPGAPIVIMIHGFRYSPSTPSRDPHRHILSLEPVLRNWGSVSWPRRLGLDASNGLGVAWGWEAGGTIWRAYRRAAASGRLLARIIARLRAAAPDRPVHIIAHSLGARVACSALNALNAGDVQRVVLLAAALSRKEARQVCATPAGHQADVITMHGAENWLFDTLLWFAFPLGGQRLAPGDVCAERWVDLSLDDPDVLDRLGRLGWRIAPPQARICHWSGYLRPGVWKFHRALLVTCPPVPLSTLRAATVQKRRIGMIPARGLIVRLAFWPIVGSPVTGQDSPP